MKPAKETHQTVAPMVALGYPAIETVKEIDVTGWEPSAIFVPVSGPDLDSVEGEE
jgi:hypothetical protein